MAITIRIDWISITNVKDHLKDTTAHTIMRDGLWSEAKAHNGYTMGQKHVSGVKAYRNPARKDMGQHMVYSSKSLDKVKEMYGLHGIDLLHYHISENHNIARIDLAIDFIGYDLTVDAFVQEYQLGNCKTRLRKATIVSSLTHDGATLYIGSMKKRKNLIRIYDKGVETGTGTDWIRYELQIMGRKATSTSATISRSVEPEETILGLIKDVVDFPTVPVWKLLMHDQLEVKMSSIPKEQGDTEKWLLKQVIPALSRTIVLDVGFWATFKLQLIKSLPENMIEEFKGF